MMEKLSYHTGDDLLLRFIPAPCPLSPRACVRARAPNRARGKTSKRKKGKGGGRGPKPIEPPTKEEVSKRTRLVVFWCWTFYRKIRCMEILSTCTSTGTRTGLSIDSLARVVPFNPWHRRVCFFFADADRKASTYLAPNIWYRISKSDRFDFSCIGTAVQYSIVVRFPSLLVSLCLFCCTVGSDCTSVSGAHSKMG